MTGESTSCTENFTLSFSTEIEASTMQYNNLDVILLSVFFPCILLFGITGNIAFLFVLVRVPWMKTSTNVFLASIAVADTVFLLVGIGEKLLRYHASPVVGDQSILMSSTGCVLLYFIIDVTYFTSIFLVTFVSYERYLAVCEPIKFRLVICRKNRTIRNVIVAWILGISFACMTIPGRKVYMTVCVLWPEKQEFALYPQTIGLCTATSISAANAVNGVQTTPFFIALFLNTILYIQIVRGLSPKDGPSQTCSTSKQNIRNKVAIMLVITGVIFFLCLAPFETMSLLQMLSGYFNLSLDSDNIHNLVQICRVLMYTNSATNSVVYILASSQYRLAFREVFAIKCILCSRFRTLGASFCETKTQEGSREIWTFNHDIDGAGVCSMYTI